jgi:hypothetical protein
MSIPLTINGKRLFQFDFKNDFGGFQLCSSAVAVAVAYLEKNTNYNQIFLFNNDVE